MIDFIQRLNVQFTDEEKSACLPVIDRIVELATLARSKGLSALEQLMENEKNFFLKTATMLIVDANDPDVVKEMLQKLILTANHCGAELLGRLIILQGIMRIAAGYSPRLIRQELNMMLGEKYLLRLCNAQKEEDEKAKAHRFEEFFEKINNEPDKNNTPSCPFDYVLKKTDGEVLQTAFKNVHDMDLSIALKGLTTYAIKVIMKNIDKSRHADIYEKMQEINSIRIRDVDEAIGRLFDAIKEAETHEN
jgi:chemotaxis protein MotA